MKAAHRSISVIMIGASGAVGKSTVASLLELSGLERLTLLGRKNYDIFPRDPRLKQIVVDFGDMDKAFESNKKEMYGHEVIISSLGTTRALAGDRATYRKIEVDYPTTFARLAKAGGAKHAVLVSSRGAKRSSCFKYLAQKGEVEEQWGKLGFDTLTILRPGLIGRGGEARAEERLFAWILKPISCSTIGHAIANRVQSVISLDAKETKALILTNPEIYAHLKG